MLLDMRMRGEGKRWRVELSGEWEYAAMGARAVSGRGIVPGSLFLDLIRNGAIADPFVGRGEETCSWIFDTGWKYQRCFELPEELTCSGDLYLVAEGIDTLAEVYLDGIFLAATDNMFRRWEIRLPEGLSAGEHWLEVRFSPLTGAVAMRRAECPLNGVGIGTFRLDGAQWLRKAAYHFGWDWGPKLPDCGIWKPIWIEKRAQARIACVQIRQKHAADGSVTILPLLAVDGRDDRDLTLAWELTDPHGRISRACASVRQAAVGELEIVVMRPLLWWPNGMGEANLYGISLRLLAADGLELDHWHSRIGLRTVKLDTTPDADGHRFAFIVNGKPVLIRGANWIPADQFLPRVGAEQYRGLLRSAVLANMNMIRVWGGGIYETDTFYDLCDEFGLLVWQDFMYACSAYPAQDDIWLANAVEEARQQVRRLCNHPCIALYCGNNEMEQFPGVLAPNPCPGAMSPEIYARLFDSALPRVVYEVHPEIAYWTSSPHSLYGMESTSPCGGDVHIWNVWWGMKPFNDYRTILPRFCSEFGFQSSPHPQTIRPVLESADCSLAGDAMAFRQRGVTHMGPGNTTLLRYMEQNLGIPQGGEAQLWRTQVLQAMALETGCDAWLSEWPYCSGVLYWQLNDCWPGPSWSTIDYRGIWKVAHYAVRRMFQPTALLWRQRYSEKDGLPCSPLVLRLLHNRCHALTLDWRVERRRLDGSVQESLTGHVQLNAEGIYDLMDINAWTDPTEEGSFLTASISDHGNELQRRIWFPGRIPLERMGNPELSVHTLDEQTAAVWTAGQCAALWVWLEGDDPKVLFSDNAFHLYPGEEKVVTCLDSTSLPNNLRARSLLMVD